MISMKKKELVVAKITKELIATKQSVASGLLNAFINFVSQSLKKKR